jgi:predicted MFS family arabinose efflux permease
MFSSKAWGAWLIASIFYAYQYILRVMPNIMLNDIMQQFNIDTVIFGQFSGAYYLGYCLMHLPIGIMLDRYSARKVISICILFTVAGLLPILFAKHWVYPIIGRFLIGGGSSAAILGAFKIIRIVFSEKYFTRMLSFTVTIGLIGAIYGGMPVSYLCGIYGYQVVVKILAVFGLILACITYIFTPEIIPTTQSTVIGDLKSVLTNAKVVLVCGLAGIMVGPLEGFADAWGSEFLKQIYNFDTKTANYLISMIYVGMCFAPILSRIGERTGRYLETIAGAGIFMLAIFIILITNQFNMQGMAIGFFIVGICCAYQILAIYKASTYVPESITGLTTAIANMIIMSFGYFFHSSIGIIIKIYSSEGKASSFIYGVSIVPIMLCIGAIGFCILSYKEQNIIISPTKQ